MLPDVQSNTLSLSTIRYASYNMSWNDVAGIRRRHYMIDNAHRRQARQGAAASSFPRRLPNRTQFVSAGQTQRDRKLHPPVARLPQTSAAPNYLYPLSVFWPHCPCLQLVAVESQLLLGESATNAEMEKPATDRPNAQLMMIAQIASTTNRLRQTRPETVWCGTAVGRLGSR